MTDQHLPAPAGPLPPEAGPGDVAPARRPLSVAFLPLALVVFVVVAFVIAAWTFLAAAG
jgi:hypothetical protein